MNCQSAEFPKELDGAKVLYYTPRSDYGAMEYLGGEIAAYYRYLAICKYPNDKSYEVVSDTVWNSIGECMNVAASSYKENIVWHQAE